ncbi:hypothetical protein [Gordonia sp. (in: high G+C Gram-positive bacteria)]|uniref:hypothetical protein n=1 Tax=Gordonia sp. (in: high G+C Gram-positive bacteria) TaxID=84139 RepID=UPI003F96E21E
MTDGTFTDVGFEIVDRDGRDIICGYPVAYDHRRDGVYVHIPIIAAFGSRLAWIHSDDLDVTPH